MEKSGKIILLLASLGSCISREVTNILPVFKRYLERKLENSAVGPPTVPLGLAAGSGLGWDVVIPVCCFVLSKPTKEPRKQLPSSFF